MLGYSSSKLLGNHRAVGLEESFQTAVGGVCWNHAQRGLCLCSRLRVWCKHLLLRNALVFIIFLFHWLHQYQEGVKKHSGLLFFTFSGSVLLTMSTGVAWFHSLIYQAPSNHSTSFPLSVSALKQFSFQLDFHLQTPFPEKKKEKQDTIVGINKENQVEESL